MNEFIPSFKAKTATELMLINKIRQLEYQLRMSIGIIPEFNTPKELTPEGKLPNILKLRPSAEIIGSVNPSTGNLEIILKGWFADLPKQIGYQYYIDPKPKSARDIEPYLTYLHERYLNEMSKFLEK